jgi:hypothetical protein
MIEAPCEEAANAALLRFNGQYAHIDGVPAIMNQNDLVRIANRIQDETIKPEIDYGK